VQNATRLGDERARNSGDRRHSLVMTTVYKTDFKDDELELQVDLGEHQGLYEDLRREDGEIRNPYD